jgi:hypothetical protein
LRVFSTKLRTLKRGDLAKKCPGWPFWQELLTLDLLKSSTEGDDIRDVLIGLIKEVAVERNRLAHGRFDQNPFSGELDALTEKANAAWMALRHAEAYYSFSDPPE